MQRVDLDLRCSLNPAESSLNVATLPLATPAPARHLPLLHVSKLKKFGDIEDRSMAAHRVLGVYGLEMSIIAHAPRPVVDNQENPAATRSRVVRIG